MVINLKELILLLPIIIIGITVILVLLSVAYQRNKFLHAIYTMFGLCVSIMSLGVVWRYRVIDNVYQLICVDNFSILCTALILISSVFSGILAYQWLSRYPNDRCDEFYLLLLISNVGGVLLTATNHLVILFVGIELLSLPLFGLIGYSIFNKYSLEASIKYVVLSGISSSFFLLGIAFIYIKTGCLLFTEIHQSLLIYQSVWLYQPMLIIGIGMMMVGFGFKLSFVPFHLWTPDVYQGSSYPVSMYLTTSIKFAVISSLIRFFLVFPNQYNEIFHIFLSIIACCSILFGSIMATQQNSIKRILAYSSIVHVGYVLIGMTVLKESSIVLESVFVYFIGYMIANIAIFSVIGIMSNEYCINEDVDSLLLYRGLFWKKPILSILCTIILLSLAGMPITLGFIGKFYLFMLGISSKLWFLIIFMSIGSVISIFYYLKIMINLYTRPMKNICMYSDTVSNWMYTFEGGIIIICTICVLFLGMYPQPMIHFIHYFV